MTHELIYVKKKILCSPIFHRMIFIGLPECLEYLNGRNSGSPIKIVLCEMVVPSFIDVSYINERGHENFYFPIICGSVALSIWEIFGKERKATII